MSYHVQLVIDSQISLNFSETHGLNEDIEIEKANKKINACAARVSTWFVCVCVCVCVCLSV